MSMDTLIQGIPCTVELEYFPAHHGAREGGLQMEPDEAAEFQIVKILKLGGNGKHLAWLEEKMTDEDRDRIINEAWGQ